LEVLGNKNIQYPDSELVLSGKNTVYHLGVTPDDVAKTILLVGDQDRVGMISSYFDTIFHQSQHREFVIHTGTYKGKEVSAISTGIGTDNIDIVVNELDALFNIDLIERKDKVVITKLNLIRIGTCGILQEHIPVNSFILSKYALGLDNVARFYDIAFSEEELQIEKQMREHLQLPSTLQPYCTKASESLFTKLSSEHTFAGITATSSGFYGPQGRLLRIPLSTHNMNDNLSDFQSVDGSQVVNFEMETSALLSLGKALGHECLTICLGIANRKRKEFSSDYQPHMERLIKYVLDTI
jgi:uridine phosphorylase